MGPSVDARAFSASDYSASEAVRDVKLARYRAITRPLNRTMPFQLPGVRCSSLAFPTTLSCKSQGFREIRDSRLTQAPTETSSVREHRQCVLKEQCIPAIC